MTQEQVRELAAEMTLADLVRLNEAVLRAAWPGRNAMTAEMLREMLRKYAAEHHVADGPVTVVFRDREGSIVGTLVSRPTAASSSEGSRDFLQPAAR